MFAIGALFINANSEIGLTRAPALRWFHYFKNHPSVMSDGYFALRGIERDSASLRQPRPVKKESTEFLRNNTTQEERITLLSSADWRYLVDAKLPSALHWMPLHLTHSRVLLERNLQDIETAPRLFLEDGYWKVVEEWNETLALRLHKIFDRYFTETKASSGWAIYSNRCLSAR